MQTLRYRGGGLMIGVSKLSGVVRFLLRTPEGGALAGVRVGDPLGALVQLWDDPPAVHGSVRQYPMGDWTVTVHPDMRANRVQSILLARVMRQAID
jgi:hypothetical protein